LPRRDDDETLEQIVYRLELLLSRHWDAFHERVEALVREHSRLPRFLPDGALAKERFGSRETPDDEIVQAYLDNYRLSADAGRVEELMNTVSPRMCGGARSGRPTGRLITTPTCPKMCDQTGCRKIVRQSGMSDELLRRVKNALGELDRYPN
jgi:hypothetical protein